VPFAEILGVGLNMQQAYCEEVEEGLLEVNAPFAKLNDFKLSFVPQT
jgi:hypothetical protein